MMEKNKTPFCGVINKPWHSAHARGKTNTYFCDDGDIISITYDNGEYEQTVQNYRNGVGYTLKVFNACTN